MVVDSLVKFKFVLLGLALCFDLVQFEPKDGDYYKILSHNSHALVKERMELRSQEKYMFGVKG